MRNGILAVAVWAAVSAAHAGTEYVDALVWNTARAPNQGMFPEQLPGAPAPAGWSPDSFGVAFSGGGTRSASATLGQLRALVALGWYQRLRYVSSVSGGTWGSLPFTYLPEGIRDEDYLGPLVAPQQLRDEHFGAAPPRSAAWAIANARLVRPALGALASGEGDESYSAALAHAFLRPFGLEDPRRGFAWSPEHARQIAARNALCADKPGADAEHAAPRRPCAGREAPPSVANADNFHLPRAGRPFHIANASLLAERTYGRTSLNDDSKFPLQITPYYTGVGATQTYTFKAVQSQLHVGGAFVESFAFDTWPPLPVAGVAAPGAAELYRAARHGQRDRFTLRDAIGVSGAAPQQVTSALAFRNLGFPEFHHWGIRPVDHTVARPVMHEFAHGDGGHVDNIGLGALLERGVRHIIVFANMLRPFVYSDQKQGQWPLQFLPPDNTIVGYFDHKPDGDTGKHVSNGMNYLLSGIAPGRQADCAPRSTGPACALQDLRRGFARKHVEGLPLVHCQAYTVNTRNPRFRVGAWTEPVHICWVYLDPEGSQGWRDALGPTLSPALRADLQARKGEFESFPNYATFFENPGIEPVQLTPAQVTALSQMTSWTVCASAPQIAREFKALGLPLKGCQGIPFLP